MKIVRAKAEDAAILTDIVLSAKRHWHYPEGWLRSWRHALIVRPEFIEAHQTYAAIAEGRTLGFYALRSEGDRLHLQHFWLLPEALMRGVGESLFAHAVERAKAQGCRTLQIECDPNAESFYKRLGARRVGVSAAELGGHHRELPIMVYEIDRVAWRDVMPESRRQGGDAFHG